MGDVLAFGTIAFEHGPHDLLREEGMYCIEYPPGPLLFKDISHRAIQDFSSCDVTTFNPRIQVAASHKGSSLSPTVCIRAHVVHVN